MKSHLLCFPCTVRAAFDIASKSTDNEALRRKVIFETVKWLADNQSDLLECEPTVFHTHVFKICQKITGNTDPFKPLKKMSNETAMRILPVLEQRCRCKNYEERFRLAALGSICGNAIDFEVEGYSVSTATIESSLLSCLNGDLAIDDTPKIMDALESSSRILYLLDNAGEIVFDKFFIKTIMERYSVKVYAAVKSGPILNDATIEDAMQVGLDECAEVIETGNDHIGLKLDMVSKEFLTSLMEADLIIAKGQGYYESLTENERILSKPIAYLLRAKCIEVARHLNVPWLGNVIKFVARSGN
ncbi:MAG: ARMT1-like domain-containing protein [Nitrososphaerota archaeon]|nr:ARMT1-like domain-containing protein [Candidatus Bathyarchaeota archaeon]MDW8048637.1 ARMT1-like domain-containing protein [Nitrososphaerota archaeon]